MNQVLSKWVITGTFFGSISKSFYKYVHILIPLPLQHDLRATARTLSHALAVDELYFEVRACTYTLIDLGLGCRLGYSYSLARS